MAYTSKEQIQNFLTIEINSSFDEQISSWISAVEKYIDKYTGRTFEESVEETRYFDGNGKREIDIDEFLSLSSVDITEISSDDVEISLIEGKGNDFVTFPYNQIRKFRLILTPESSIASWYSGLRRLKVSGKWGNSESVPDDIQLAATLLVASIVERGLNGGKVSSESLGDYSVSFSDMENSSNVLNAKNILKNYKTWKL